MLAKSAEGIYRLIGTRLIKLLAPSYSMTHVQSVH